MAKRVISNEQYFTTPDLAQRCVAAVSAAFPLGEFAFIVEPSAGDGTFLNILPEEIRIGLDIAPQAHMEEALIKTNFFDWEPPTRHEGDKVLTIGNPPFGARGSLAVKFIHHAATYSDVIAFILPRGFNKYTFQNRIPKQFHLAASFDCDDFYIPDGTPEGTPVSVKTVFQIWEKKEEEREQITFPSQHEHFEMTHAHISRTSPEALIALKASHPFTIPQVGANFAPRASAVLTQGSHWFIKPLVAGVEETFARADYSFLDNMNTAHTSLSKTDIIRAYSAAASQTRM